MPDICIFYSKPDEKKVEALSAILEDLGWSVWWDKHIKNGRWGPEIERNIKTSRCVIPIWNSHGVRTTSITFVEAETSRKLNKPMITVISERIDPPFPFVAEHISTNLSEWDCSRNADCVGEIVESVESVLGIAPRKWKGERPSMINLIGKQVKLPCFVKSLSSHETQLDPEAGLTVISLFPEADALLVSAYDMFLMECPEAEKDRREKEESRHTFMCEQLKKLDDRGAFILMDSGNYEKSRKNDDNWTEDKFNWVLENVPFSYAFCFDNLYPSSDSVENVTDVISRMAGDFENSLIPILHAPEDTNGIRDHNVLPEIFFEYASRKSSPFIAVPERELGDGICKKAETISRIREKLNTLGRYQPIHILGTGNPLSILILAAAGADFFDGLEWCRTVADRDTGYLFHHQQFDFFRQQTIERARYDIVRAAMLETETSSIFKMGFHNLDFFHEWMEDLQTNLRDSRIGQMLAYHTSKTIYDEITKALPGLMK